MSGQMKYRLPVDHPQSTHVSTYRQAISDAKQLLDNRGYYHYAGIHGAPGRWCWHHQFSQRSNLSARLFLPWHRAYLHRLEQALQDIDESVALPWWDWTEGEGVPDAFSLEQINGEANVLFSTDIALDPPQVPASIRQTTHRQPDTQLPVFTFPVADVNSDGIATLAEIVDYLVEHVTTYEDFNDLLESVHDAIHVYVGGSMADVSFAAYDPIFFSHHCMIDRVWALWQRQHGVNNFPTALESVVLEPFGLTAKDVLNTQSLGYEYATSQVDINLSDLDIGRAQ